MPVVVFKLGGIFDIDPIASRGNINDYIDLNDNNKSFKSFISIMRPTGGRDDLEDENIECIK